MGLLFLKPFKTFIVQELYDPYWNNVVLAMHMDGADNGTVFTDEKGHTFTYSGSPVTKTGVKMFGNSSLFSSNGSLISNSTDYAPGTGDFTIEFWFLWDGTQSGTTTKGLIHLTSSLDGTNNGTGFFIERSLGNQLFYIANNSYYSASSNVAVTPYMWYHVAFSRYNGTSRIFLNGVQTASFSDTRNLSTSTFIQIGGYAGGVGSQWSHTGYVDDVRITKGVARYTANFIPPAQSFPNEQSYDYDPYWNNVVLAMHMDGTNGSTTFVEETGKSVAVSGSAQISTAQSKFGGASAYFNRYGHVSVSSNDLALGSGAFTIEMYVYPHNVGSAQPGWFQLSSTPGGITTNYSSGVAMLFNNNLTIIVGTGKSYVVMLGGSPQAYAWNHIAVVRESNGSMRVFLNGIQVATGSSAGSIPNSTHLAIGGYYSSSFFMDGYVDEVRITKGVARYTANFTPPTKAFPNEQSYSI